jgi:hypothetical protein
MVLTILHKCHIVAHQANMITWPYEKKSVILTILKAYSTFIHEVVGALIQLHENAQDSIISQCMKEMCKFNIDRH